MQSSLVSKIEKARRYSQERHRIRFTDFTVRFHGDHNEYVVTYKDGTWACGCPFFSQRGLCSHTMALERVLGEMLATPQPAP